VMAPRSERAFKPSASFPKQVCRPSKGGKQQGQTSSHKTDRWSLCDALPGLIHLDGLALSCFDHFRHHGRRCITPQAFYGRCRLVRRRLVGRVRFAPQFSAGRSRTGTTYSTRIFRRVGLTEVSPKEKERMQEERVCDRRGADEDGNLLWRARAAGESHGQVP